MASYDYRCRTCDHTFEVRRSVTERETTVRCPAGHGDVGRIWSAVGLTGTPGARQAAPTSGCCGGGCCG